MPPVGKDSAKRHSTKRVHLSFYEKSYSSLADQGPGIARVQQKQKDQRAKNSDVRPFVQVSASPHTVHRIYCVSGSCQLSTGLGCAASRSVNHATKLVNVGVTSTFSSLIRIDSIVASKMSQNAWTLVLIQETCSPSGFAFLLSESSASDETLIVLHEYHCLISSVDISDTDCSE